MPVPSPAAVYNTYNNVGQLKSVFLECLKQGPLSQKRRSPPQNTVEQAASSVTVSSSKGSQLVFLN